MADLRGRTLFITGGSRGIGKAIALRAAAGGATSPSPGWSCVPPRGALYAFPRFFLGALKDTELVRDMILDHGIVMVHGSGVGQEGLQPRIVFLPPGRAAGDGVRTDRGVLGGEGVAATRSLRCYS